MDACKAFEKLLSAPGGPAGCPFHIHIVYTGEDRTLSALRRASELARGLDTKVHIMVPQIVPYPLPLTSPPVLLEFNERRFRAIAKDQPVETSVEIYLCRDRTVMLRDNLKPNSLVLIGTHLQWWPIRERILARSLRRLGHK